jgi:predicted nucleic acid-binding protein
MLYFDSSYIVKCYVVEPGSAAVLDLAQSAPGMASSVLGRVEFRSAIHRHVRENKLTPGAAEKVFQRMTEDERAGVWSWLPLTSSLTELVCTKYEHLAPSVFLRSFDAIHLACASENGFTEIYSNDKHLLNAAHLFGITGNNVIV